jgi:hypothetical protein
MEVQLKAARQSALRRQAASYSYLTVGGLFVEKAVPFLAAIFRVFPPGQRNPGD